MKNDIRNLVLTAMLFAIGMVLPFLTGQIPEIGNMLLPLHLPVLVCGFVCGWQWGLTLGFLLPLVRSVTFGMPPMVPIAMCMAFEMAAYGTFSGLLYRRLSAHSAGVYVTLIGAMLLGRVVWGVASWVVWGLFTESSFSVAMFWLDGFVQAWPGIVLQLILVPAIVLALQRAGFIPSANERGASNVRVAL